MIPRSTYNANSTVHTKSGTCSSVSYVLRYASPITARPATFIATLRCETLSEQVRQRLTDALTHKWPTPPAPALIRESDHSAASILDFRPKLGNRCKLCRHPCCSPRGICAVAALLCRLPGRSPRGPLQRWDLSRSQHRLCNADSLIISALR